MGQRVIDVVFVHPKNRQLVIWHKGEWWQVTKMQLTDNAWQYKTPYTGSLEEIYVAKEQAVSCQHLAKTLQTHELPSELRSISAAKFLSWWSVNDFDWLNRQNHQSHAMLNNNQAHTPADSTPSDSTANDKTANDKHALADNSTSPSIQQPATQSAAKPAPATTKTAQPVKTSEPASATPAATPSAQPAQTTNTNSNTKAAAPQDNTPTKTPASKAVPKAAAASTTHTDATTNNTAANNTPTNTEQPTEMDIFDSLLQELNEEILHQK